MVHPSHFIVCPERLTSMVYILDSLWMAEDGRRKVWLETVLWSQLRLGITVASVMWPSPDRGFSSLIFKITTLSLHRFRHRVGRHPSYSYYFQGTKLCLCFPSSLSCPHFCNNPSLHSPWLSQNWFCYHFLLRPNRFPNKNLTCCFLASVQGICVKLIRKELKILLSF